MIEYYEGVEKNYDQFGFGNADALTQWSQTFKPDFKISVDKDIAIYTDGDCGVALINLTDAFFGNKSLTITYIGCVSCDFNWTMLSKIRTALIEGEQ